MLVLAGAGSILGNAFFFKDVFETQFVKIKTLCSCYWLGGHVPSYNFSIMEGGVNNFW